MLFKRKLTPEEKAERRAVVFEICGEILDRAAALEAEVRAYAEDGLPGHNFSEHDEAMGAYYGRLLAAELAYDAGVERLKLRMSVEDMGSGRYFSGQLAKARRSLAEAREPGGDPAEAAAAEARLEQEETYPYGPLFKPAQIDRFFAGVKGAVAGVWAEVER